MPSDGNWSTYLSKLPSTDRLDVTSFAEQSMLAACRRPSDHLLESFVVSLAGMVQLGASTIIFVLAASAAKAWTLAPAMWRLALVLGLYTAGNLIMLRLIREFGMGIALSLSAVIQLVAVNLVALLWFGEKLGTLQTIGVMAAIVGIALITVGPYLSAR